MKILTHFRRRPFGSVLFSLLVVGVFWPPASRERVEAWTGGPPALGMVLPRGARRGTQVTARFSGARLYEAQEILFHEPGFETVELKQIDGGNVEAVLNVDPTCALGAHKVRVRTAYGVSNLKLFFVGDLPEIQEQEPNDAGTAQAIELPVTVNGVILSEDVDRFSFHATKGQTVAFEVEGLRLGDTLFDPRLAVLDASGTELAVVDDYPLWLQDAACVAPFPDDGTYFVEVRETAYGGNGSCHYRLHAGAFPRPTAAIPCGGQAGSEIEVKWIGDPSIGASRVTLPPTPGTTPIDVGSDMAAAPSPMPFRVVAGAAVIETEPNDTRDQATPIPVPGGASGLIDGERDVDTFAFEGKKGQTFEARVFARRLGSPLDPVLNVFRAGGQHLGGSDDSAGPDGVFRWTCPDDDRYTLEVRDLLFKSGDAFHYFLEVEPVRPALTTTISTPDASCAVPAGNRAGFVLTAHRRDFGGPLRVEAENLPPGTTLHADLMNEAVSQVPVVIEAAPDAAPSAAPADLKFFHADPGVDIRGRLEQDVELVKYLNNPFYSVSVDRLAVAVTKAAPFTVETVEPKAPMAPRGSMGLRVKIQRAEGFDGTVHARLLWNPPGVGSGETNLNKDQTEGILPLNAGDGAPIGTWKTAVVASTIIDGAAVEVAGALFTLEIAPPFVDFVVERARAEQGRPVEVVVKVTLRRDFEGEAQARLLGLPPKVSAPPVTITKDTREIRYQAQVDKDAPPGHHGSLFVHAALMDRGEPVHHHSPAGLLIIDPPLPPKDPEKEAARLEAIRKAREEKERLKAERIAALRKRREEMEAKRKEANASTSDEANDSKNSAKEGE